ncbi:DNA-binding MarR family transcriptional regulator [Bradyrhizobium sp. USDA 10063]
MPILSREHIEPAEMSYLDGSLGYALHRAQLAVFEGILQCFAESEVTAAEFLVLVVVAENPGINQADLAKSLEVERPRIVPTLNSLEKRGLAKRTQVAEDARVRQIHLTKSGHQLVKVLQRRARDHQKRIMARLDATEAKVILSCLWKLAGRECPAEERIRRNGAHVRGV